MSPSRCVLSILLLVPLALGLQAAKAAECNDLVDNDGDGAIDLLDSDCTDAADPFEGVGVLGVQKISDTRMNPSTNWCGSEPVGEYERHEPDGTRLHQVVRAELEPLLSRARSETQDPPKPGPA